jgi:hypothetical protein
VGLKEIGYDFEDVNWINLSQDGVNSKSCESDNETSISTKGRQFLGFLQGFSSMNLTKF